MKRENKIIVIVAIVIIVLLTAFVIIGSKIRIKDYSNSNFKVSYDTTWKVKDDKDQLYLIHKKSGSELKIQCLVLEPNYIDTDLSELIDDITYSIAVQDTNKDYVLINREVVNGEYSYLYENNDKQALVKIRKKDAKVLIVYYESDSKHYDIVLDSVDMILDSLEFVFE